MTPEQLDRFESKVHVEPTTGCRLWIGAQTSTGYGLVVLGSRRCRAHVAAWEHERGPVPDGLELDHVRARGCSSTLCVNVEHLQPVTHAENMRRQIGNVRKAVCDRGHALVGSNVATSKVGRSCKACRAESQRRRRARVAA